MVNQSSVTEFFLMGFSDLRELQILHFVVFLCIYLAAIMGNVLLILTVAQNHHLHSPMHFFLVNLSFIDLCYISTTVPKSMANSLTNDTQISFSGCVTQVFLILTLAGTELFVLTVMAYDRYVAICRPLQYVTIMNWNACLQMAAASWTSGIIISVIYTANTFSLMFCWSNYVEQYFCDIPQLLAISCTDTMIIKMSIVVEGLVLGSFCFSFIFVSYGYIFSAVFKIPSIQGRQKAFSTCIPHLTVFCLFLFTVLFSYLKPKALSSPLLDLLAAVLYTILPPLMNPIIYSLRNKDILTAIRGMCSSLILAYKVRSNFHCRQ